MKRSYRPLPIPLRPLLNKVARLRGLQVTPVPPNGTERETYTALSKDPIKTIFDVGANVGKVTKAFAAAFPEAMIYSFEPVASTFKALQISTARLDNVRAIQMAVGSQQGEVRMTVNHDSELNRITDDNAATTENVSITSIDAFCVANGIDTIDILKTDTEGHELEVLRGADGALKRARFALVEFGTVPDDPSHVSFDHVYARLCQHGFTLVSIFEPSYTRSGLLRYANALFFRPRLGNGSRSSHQDS